MQAYTVTSKGRAVLHSVTLWGLSGHLRDLLALCEPRASLCDLRQFMPPASLQAALFALQELELIDGPPAAENGGSTVSLAQSPSDTVA